MTNRELKMRSGNWDFLRSTGVVLLWEPFMVDVAISLPYKLTSLDTILTDPNFLVKCALRSLKTGMYSGFEWRKRDILEMSDRGAFFFNFAKRAAKKVIHLCGAGERNIGDANFEDVCSVVLEAVADSVGKFQPVSKIGRGGVTWGFEAYLHNYTVKRAIRPALQIFGSPVAPKNCGAFFVSVDGVDPVTGEGNLSAMDHCHPDVFSDPSPDLVSIGEKDCKKIIFDAVKSELRGRPSAEAYYFHVIEGRTIRDTCRILQISKSRCHRLVQDACDAVWKRMSTEISFLD